MQDILLDLGFSRTALGIGWDFEPEVLVKGKVLSE
jgi:hypothetical protein